MAEALLFMCKVKKTLFIYFVIKMPLHLTSIFLQADLFNKSYSQTFTESEICRNTLFSLTLFSLFLCYVFLFCLFSFPASLRSELNHIHASAIEHLRQTHHQESAAAKMELEKTLENNRLQVQQEACRCIWTAC